VAGNRHRAGDHVVVCAPRRRGTRGRLDDRIVQVGARNAGQRSSWDPPNRIVFDGGEGVDGLAFEWTVKARDGGTCVVRLVNSGFSADADGDDYFDGMTEGWRIFLFNLQLHLEHFGGQSATAVLPTASWAGPRADAWEKLTSDLGVASEPKVGERIEVDGLNSPPLAGTVAHVSAGRISLVLDLPSAGTAFIAAEGRGDSVETSIWCYLYGADGIAAAERDSPLWQSWLDERSADDFGDAQ